MRDFILSKFNLPDEIKKIFESGKKYIVPKDRDELFKLSMGNEADVYEVKYDVEGRGEILEATVTKAKNGIVANYTESYMRKREPDCLFIADKKPTDKETFNHKFGYDFEPVREHTFRWLSERDLIVMPFMSGDFKYGYPSLFIGPLNAAFFAATLADMQGLIPLEKIPDNFTPRAMLYLAPTFRHTHFNGKQVVIHNRLDGLHEVFSYNLYPGPSAKKGIYGVLLSIGEEEQFTTLHASTVKVLIPEQKRKVTIMHEGASGSGKTEMSQHVGADVSGRLTFGVNTVTGEQEKIKFHSVCKIRPVTDDMALAHPNMQKGTGRLVVKDAEDAWFIRSDNITQVGTDVELERLWIKPKEPLVFLNLDIVPHTTALPWEHYTEGEGKVCSNPRAVIPKNFFPRVVDSTVEIDIRSFGVRTPPCTRDNPSYGIIGMFHMLPPAIAWLWRLVAPRGFSNPSIVETAGMSSEGVGSYWPFAAGKMVTQANLLLKQINDNYKVKYILTPNQHIGAWKVGFMPQWLAREFFVLNGDIPIRKDMMTAARTPLLGYTLNEIELPMTKIDRKFIEVNLQPEVGDEAYDRGAQMLNDFFRQELQKYLTPELCSMGREIIECFMRGGSLEEYENIML